MWEVVISVRQAAFYRVAVRAIALCLLVLFLLVLSTSNFSPAIAASASLQKESTAEQTATLIGPKADAPIPIYLRPAANQPNVGYGRNGDTVSVLEEFGDFLIEENRVGDRAATWSHIRLENQPYTEGWVRGISLLFEKEQPD